MTEKEAIERLKLHQEWGWQEETAKAISVGIKALQTVTFLQDCGLEIDKLKEVDYHKEVIEKINYNAYMELMNEVLELREKQTPYIPKPYKQYAGTCKCGVIFMDRTTNYCGNCGQRLDWGD